LKTLNNREDYGMQEAINHCGMRDKIRGSHMSTEDLKEAVIERVGEIVSSAVTGKPVGKPSEFGGIELMAQAIARRVIAEGAEKVAKDVNLDLAELTTIAKSEHISFC